MNLTTINFNSNNNLYRKNSIKQYDFPFVKMTIEGKKGETTHIIRKLNKSKSYISGHLHKLLFTGFNGNLEDLYKVYRINQNPKKRKPKSKIRLNNSLLLKNFLLFKPVQKTVVKEFNFMNKNKEKILNMKTLLPLLNQKEKFKQILYKNKEKIGNKSACDISSKNITNMKATYDQKNLNENNYYDIIEKNKENSKKMKKINTTRKLLLKKSRNMLKIDENKSTFETFRNSQENKEKEQKLEQTEKNLKNLRRIQIIRGIIEKSEKKKKKYKLDENIKQTFKRLLPNEVKDDKEKMKKVLDPLSLGFKDLLKEVPRYEGKDKRNIWMKKSTANIVSFGNSFQLMADDLFYKDHKRMIDIYPNIEREANLIVPERKVRENNKIIERMEDNERKIRNIINENYCLLKIIKVRNANLKKIKYSNSQPSIYPKKKFIKK